MSKFDMRIKMDYMVNDLVYIVKKERLFHECPLCFGHGKIELGIATEYGTAKEDTVEEYKCPKCDGLGRIYINKKEYVAFEEPCKVLEVKVVIKEENGESVGKVTYKLQGKGNSIFTRESDMIFDTYEDAVASLEALNTTKKVLALDEIIIDENFKRSVPSLRKINAKMAEYNEDNAIGNITVNKQNVLVDGYINYKICQLLDIKTIEVTVVD